MSEPIESKVAIPAIVTALTGTLGGALYAALLAFGLFHPTMDQQAALTGLGAALLVVEQTVLGYFAPHTTRGAEIDDETVDAIAEGRAYAAQRYDRGGYLTAGSVTVNDSGTAEPVLSNPTRPASEK